MFHETNLYGLLDSLIEVRKRSDDVEALRKIQAFIDSNIMKDIMGEKYEREN